MFNYYYLKIFLYLKNFFAPIYCYYCNNNITNGRKYQIICDICMKNIKTVISTQLKLTKNINILVHAVSEYKKPLNLLVLEKSRFNYLASIQLAHIIWELSNLKNIEFDYLVPIPLHWTRYAYRGYNQAQVIAQELSRLAHKPILDCLKRIKKTKFQSNYELKDKAINVSEAFELSLKRDKKNDLYKEKIFMLVDDVMTSGSTLKEAAKELLCLKPKSIQAIVVCKVQV